jgi:hypothetical protein
MAHPLVRFAKGGVTATHTEAEATATSAAVDCRGYNAVLVHAVFTGAANWTIKLQGAMTKTGTFVDWYEQANTGTMTAMSYQTNASKGWIWKGIPDWIKIVATEDVNGQKVTINVQPINV